MNNCKNCGKETKNRKFCSRSCSNSANNRVPKRKLTKECRVCKRKIRSNVIHCKDCWLKIRNADFTLSEAVYNHLHKSSAYALVRTRARTLAKKNNMNSCEECGYDKHVEIAHIKPISSFSDSSLISEINDLSNLRALCPNCHWEFDNQK